MPTCIWCSKSEPSVSFDKKAHTFPKSLGGEYLCENVCDSCNHYFGSPSSRSPAIEVVLKEILNISKYLLLEHSKESLKNKRFKSEYFDINWNKHIIKLKQRYSLRKGYQAKLGRLFRRGLYKVFLEERERQKNDALDSRFDFIREFARYDFCDYPVYYLKPKFQALLYSREDVLKPTIRFTPTSDEIDNEFKVFDYVIMGHTFCIPTSRYFSEFYLTNYRKHLAKTDNAFGTELIPINYVEDIDFLFMFMNEK